MEPYIVRQTITDNNEKTIGYEVMYTDELVDNTHQNDSTAANAIESFLSSIDSGFTGGKTAFISFTRNLLLKNIPKMFDTDKLVIQIEDSLITNPASHSLITKYKQAGYSVAVVDFEFAPRYFGVLDIVDYIKINFKDHNDPSLENIVKIGRSFGKDIIAYNIDSAEAYDKARQYGCTGFQGSYVSEKTPSALAKSKVMQSSFMMLMAAVNKDEPDIDEIEEIVSRDVSLSYALLKLVNSAYFALRNRAKSVKQALVILGIGQLKQWIYLLSFKTPDGALPDELIKLSFLRGKFCEELVQHADDMPISRSEAYLMGMFSTLGRLMNQPLADLLAQIPISDEIKDALVKREGKAGILFDTVLSYESANWIKMKKLASEIGIPHDIINEKYCECLLNVNTTWDKLMEATDFGDGE